MEGKQTTDSNDKGNLLFKYRFTKKQYIGVFFTLFMGLFCLFLFPFFIVASYSSNNWLLFITFSFGFIYLLWNTLTFPRYWSRMHFDIYENGIWYPYPILKLRLGFKWTGTFHTYDELVNLEIGPAPHSPKNYLYLKFITLSSEEDMVYFPNKDAEMLYEKIMGAWENYKKEPLINEN